VSVPNFNKYNLYEIACKREDYHHRNDNGGNNNRDSCSWRTSYFYNSNNKRKKNPCHWNIGNDELIARIGYGPVVVLLEFLVASGVTRKLLLGLWYPNYDFKNS